MTDHGSLLVSPARRFDAAEPAAGGFPAIVAVRDARPLWGGDVAQLGERLVRNEEVVGSIPIISTIPLGLGQAQRNPDL